MAISRELALQTMEDPITKHRLELLERTVYALQAQHRLLDYRIQYMEGENKALRLKASQKNSPSSENQLPQNAHVHRPRDLSDLDNFSVSEEPKDRPSNSQVIDIPKRSVSQSILDEPSPINTPVLTPARMKRSVSSLRNVVANAIPFIPAHVEVSIKSPNEAKEVKEVKEETVKSSATEELELPTQPAEQDRKSPVPWDGTISWKIFNIFKDRGEERQAMHNAALMIGDGRLEEQWIFQYGLRYLPQPDDSDAYRTVRVEGLPRDITMDKVLAEVCYGEVYSIDLLNTFGITGYHTARVTFLHQKSALAFCKYSRKKGVYIEGVRVRCTLEKTATYPIGRHMRDAIDNDCCSRCLTVLNVDSSLLLYTRSLIERSYLKYSTETLDLEGDTISIRFHSMRAAAFAYQKFTNDSAFGQCILKYGQDPCNRTPSSKTE